MRTDSFLNFPIETVDWGTLAPIYPFRFKGPGYLYCNWCAHHIRLVRRTEAGVNCSACGQALALAPSSFIQEDSSATKSDPLSENFSVITREEMEARNVTKLSPLNL